jgi:Ca2+-binding RTX toxin-like protein
MPDLVLENVEFNGESVFNGEIISGTFTAGEEVRFDWDVHNIGNGNAGSSQVNIGVLVNGSLVQLDYNSTNSLDSGETDTNEYDRFNLPSNLDPGTYWLYVWADGDGEVAESVEDNNGFLVQIEIEEPEAGQPDLTLTDVDVGGQNISFGDTVDELYRPGDEFEVEIDIQNIGNGDASSSEASVYIRIDGANYLLDTNSTSSLDAGQSDTAELLSFTIPSDLAPGTYSIVVLADAAGEIAESNEGNNGIAFNIQVAAPEPSTFAFANGPFEVNEGDGSFTVTLTRSSTSGEETVYVSTVQNLGVSNNDDYGGLNTHAVTFANGSSTAQVTISISEDNFEERDETFSIWLQENASDPFGAFADSTTFTIVDNDAVSVSTDYNLTPESADIIEGDVGTSQVTFTVTRSGNLPSETIYYSTLHGSASQASGDYIGAVDLSLTFAAGQTTATFSIDIIGDTQIEGVEDFRVMINDAPGQSSSVALDISNLTILDDDQSSGSTTFAIVNGPFEVNEDDGSFTVTLTRSTTNGAETVYVSTVQNLGALNNGDYGGLNTHAVTFANGSSTAQVTISLTDDFSQEFDETFSIWLQENAEDPYGTYADSTTFTILDDDTAIPSATFSLATSDTSVVENDRVINFTVTRTGDTSNTATVYYSTFPGTASAGRGDYVGASYSPIAFAAGSSTASFQIQIREDGQDEFNETFSVGITLEQYAGTNETVAIQQITIIDDDVSSVDPLPTPVVETEPNNDDNMITISGDGEYIVSAGSSQTLEILSDTPILITTWYQGETSQTNSQTIHPLNGLISFSLENANSTQAVVISVEIDSSPELAGENGLVDDFLLGGLDKLVSASEWLYAIKRYVAAVDVLDDLPPSAIEVLFADIENVLEKTVGGAARFTDFGVRANNVAQDLNPAARFYAEIMDFIWGEVASIGGRIVGTILAGAMTSGFGTIAGGFIGNVVGGILYDLTLSDQVIEHYQEVWLDSFSSINNIEIGPSLSGEGQVDLSSYIFDEVYYAENHPESIEAVLAGEASNLFAHFLAEGVAAGHLPNANASVIDPASLTIDLATFDPRSFGTPAVFTASAGTLAGDQLSQEERGLADALNASEGTNLNINSELSALANRIARDWMTNNPQSGLSQQDGGDPSAWASVLSDGNSFTSGLAALGWGNIQLENIQVLGLVTGAGTAEVALQQFLATDQGEAILTSAAMNSIGVGEYGGLWIITVSADVYPDDADIESTSHVAYQFGDEASDVLFAGASAAYVELNGGDDAFVGGRFGDEAYGGGGNDVLNGGAGYDTLIGGSGNDTVAGGNGRDHVYLGNGNDRYTDTTQSDAHGRDTVFAGNGNDYVHTGGGNDVLNGGAGNDTLIGGRGADDFVFVGNFGRDVIHDFDATNGAEDIVLTNVNAITDFADLSANHLNQAGSDVLIFDGSGNTITLLNTSLTDLDDSDFIF